MMGRRGAGTAEDPALRRRARSWCQFARNVLSCSAVVLFASGAWGCGPSLALGALKAAGQQVARAEFVGASDLAPFEYYRAVEYELKARTELADGDFGDALRLARLASSFASSASAQSVKRRDP